MLNELVYPTLGKRPIQDIRRSDIVKLLDKIEDAKRPRYGRSDVGNHPTHYELARQPLG